MINANKIIELQVATVERWHNQSIENPFESILATICKQHSFNFLLWHEEDIARSHDVTDGEIARVKRSIDGYNQQRNDWIEKIDDEIASLIETSGVQVDGQATLNTETPGSVMDRLSILALRVYHLREQLDRDEVSDDHLESVRQKIAICLLQQEDLKNSLQQLLDDIFAGNKRHRTYRQFKMYNDPTLNPYLYKAKSKLQPSAGATH